MREELEVWNHAGLNFSMYGSPRLPNSEGNHSAGEQLQEGNKTVFSVTSFEYLVIYKYVYKKSMSHLVEKPCLCDGVIVMFATRII